MPRLQEPPAIGGVLSAIGSTPLVRLTRLFRDDSFRVFAKLESLNPGGSLKDRPALAMVIDGFASGRLERGRSVVVESSSGNLGIGLAQVCRYFDLRFICVVDPKTTDLNVSILRAYGAEVEIVTERDAATGEYLPVRQRRVAQLLRELPSAFWPNQHASLANARAHEQTMREIHQATGGPDFLFCATSTCGTLRGCAEYVRDHGLPTRIVAVDAAGSVIFGGQPGPRLIPGHGAAMRPGLYRPGLADLVVHVTDAECIAGCRMLAVREAMLAGGSSGAVVAAVAKLRDQIAAGACCVVILPDRGERYLDTLYSDAWIDAHFGDGLPYDLWGEIQQEPIPATA